MLLDLGLTLRAAAVAPVHQPTLPVHLGDELLLGGAAQATEVLLIPDADADGAAIAARWLSVAPTATTVDIGDIAHEPTEPLPPWARRKLAGPTGKSSSEFAQAILERGYGLEEEMLVVRALERALAMKQK